jgi:uncharacterized protein YmfQ (DUF2313 family)
MPRSYKEYARLLMSLLPRGRFWTRSKDSVLYEFMQGCGDELSRIEGRAEDLINEAYPTQIQETFEEWEADFALPDEGKDISSIDSERRERIHAKLVATGQQNAEYFEDIASALGYTIEIEGIQKSLAGLMTAGSSVATNDYSCFYWFVNIDVTAKMQQYFTKANISQLIIDITKWKPAHTIVLFRFTEIAFSRGFSHGFDMTPYYDGSWWPLGFGSGFSNGFANNSDYDGVMLTGGFHSGFNLGFDSYRGGGFNYDGFSTGFWKPS